ncbi:MAG: ArsR/SmtB family transcription factor, partial [Candidatus Bipolaricaulia bacterium]
MELEETVDPAAPHRAAEVFHALSNEHRVRIVRQLLAKSMSCDDPEACDLSESCCDVGELAANLNIAAPTVSYHLKELKSAGLIAAQRRGRRLYY